MVQLKVHQVILPTRQIVISIPYGAIKSSKELACTTSTILFQFLMVQLKVRWRDPQA